MYHNDSEIKIYPAWTTAKRLHALGLQVVPSRPGSKIPAIAWKRWQTERITPEQVNHWSEYHADFNYCILTGRLSGVVVVEADNAEAEAEILKRCPPTPVQQVSGGIKPDGYRSRHFVYRYPSTLPEGWDRIKTQGGVCLDGNEFKIDIRGDGGEIVGPGSLRPDTGDRYRMAEEWTADLLGQMPEFNPAWLALDAPRMRSEAPQGPRTAFDLSEKQQAASEWLGRQKGATQGDGADKYAYALAVDLLWGFDLTPEEALPLFCEWGERPDQLDAKGNYYPWTEAEIAHKLDDAEAEAKDDNPRGWRLGDEIGRLTEQLLKSRVQVSVGEPVGDLAEGENTTPAKQVDPIMGGDDIDAAADAELFEFIVDDLLEEGSVNMISGRSLSGKTRILTQGVGNILEGTSFLGHATKPAAVLYLNCDMNRIRRLRDQIKRGMVSPNRAEAFRRRMFMVRNDCLPSTLTAEIIALYAEAVRQRLGGDTPIVIIIDTFRSAFMSNAEKGTENDPIMMKYIKPIREWVVKTKNAVWIVHHNNKHADDFSGSGAFLMLLDSKWNYRRAEDEALGTLSVSTRNSFGATYNIGLDHAGRPVRADLGKSAAVAQAYGTGQTTAAAYLSYLKENGLAEDQYSIRTFQVDTQKAISDRLIVCREQHRGQRAAIYKNAMF
jgi:hypothetical protein